MAIEQLVLGYACSGGAQVTRLVLYWNKMDGSFDQTAITGTWSSASWDQITMAPIANWLSEDQAQVALRVYCTIPNGGSIEFTGVRVRVRHS